MESQHPGVHIDEVATAPPRIEPAPTSVTGFIGTFPAGPQREPTTVRSAAEFAHLFDDAGVSTVTSIAVYDFFANGGSQAVIVAVGGPDESPPVELVVRGLLLLQTPRGEAPPVQLLCIPDMALLANDPSGQKQFKELLLRVTGFCMQNRVFLIVDPNTAGDQVSDIEQWLKLNPSSGSTNSALYFPRLHTPASKAIVNKPGAASGAVAGVMARIDNHRGVWKAPAGREASLGATVATEITDREQSPLNRHGVNVIRPVDGADAVIWGARTGVGSITSDFRYVPVRRTALFLEHSLIPGLQWAVSESNAAPLWAQITESVSNFMDELWRHGAFRGTTQAEAFFVRCDDTTMARVDLRRGRTVVHVGFAPLKPAEFVVIQIVLDRN